MTQSEDTSGETNTGIAQCALIRTETEAGSDASRISMFDPNVPVSGNSIPLLADYFRRGAKSETAWRCGLEFEVFGYTRRNLQRLDARQVETVLLALACASGKVIFEGEIAIESTAARDVRVTVEPGGQIELSGAPRKTLAEIERDARAFILRLHEIAEENGFMFLATGFDPIRTIQDQQWFPKARYEIMRPFLAARGARAWDMMCRTCAVQCNLDYGSEQDLAQKYVLGNRLAPITTAIFANSPFEHATLSGYLSTRAAAWLETDAERSNVSPLAFTDDFSLNAFVDYALAIQMIFTRRGNRYTRVADGISFRAFLDGAGSEGAPIFQDWTDHLTTIFTEARLKQHIELRSADCGTLELTMAAQALWKGLLYDAAALEEALRLAPLLQREEAFALQQEVAQCALAARTANVNVLGVAKEIVALAASGLARVAPDEVKYLDVLRQLVIEDEICPADILLRNWRGAWHGSIERVVEHLRIA